MDNPPVQNAEIIWRDGVLPVSAAFDDPYFSLNGGLAETRHVFLAGNHLPSRFRPGFHIAELGFGTGLNALAAWSLWRQSGQEGQLRFTSFEAFPLSAEALEKALSAWPDLADLAMPLLQAWAQGANRLETGDFALEVNLGDARQTLPRWTGQADAWFLDGFSPAKNPELWSSALMEQVARHTRPEGTFATYTAAGHVRRALADAGFSVERLPGFAGKKHMTRGRLS